MTDYEFLHDWKDHHSKLLDVSAEVSFYYGVFRQLRLVLDGENIADKKADRMAFILTLHVEDLAGPKLYPVICKHIPECSDIVAWLAGTVRPVLMLSDDCKRKLHEKIAELVPTVSTHIHGEWFRKCVLSHDFLEFKGLLIWLCLDHYIILQYGLNPLFMLLDLFQPIYMGARVEAQQAAQSYLAFNWTFPWGQTLPELVDDWAKENCKHLYEFLTFRKMKSVKPTLYRVVSRIDENYILLKDQDGKLWGTCFDECSRTTHPERVVLTMMCDYGTWCHFNGPGVWFDKERWGKWDNVKMWRAFTDLEEEPGIYPRLIQHKELWQVDYHFVPEDPGKYYQKVIGDALAYYDDTTAQDLDDALKVMEGFALQAAELSKNSSMHFHVFCICYWMIFLFSRYYSMGDLQQFSSYNGRIRRLFQSIEKSFLDSYITGQGHDLRGMASDVIAAELLSLNKEPFFKRDKIYSLNHLIKELKKRR